MAKIEDVGCSFIAMSPEVFNQLDFSHGKGFTIEAWIKTQIIARNLKFVQVPVECTYYEKSGVKRGLKMFFEVEWFIIKEGLKFRLWDKRNYLFWLDKLRKSG